MTVPNQAAPIPDHDSWECDPSSRWWLAHLAAQLNETNALTAHDDRLASVGQAVGSIALRDAADRANTFPPRLATWDRFGARIDQVVFDRSWHQVIETVTSSGVCGLPWNDASLGYLVRAAAMEQWARIDMGVMCPVTMTAAAVPVLQRDVGGPGAALATSILDAASDGTGAGHPLMGMAMTEPQGGSDLSASTTTARRGDDSSYLLNGHKWFCSHPTADGLLVLARDADVPSADTIGSRGLSCYLMQGWDSQGARNGIQLQRLKDKLGTRSLASSEVIFDDAAATRIGDPGRGVPTIIEMVVHTRMDCVIGNAGILARAVGEAVNHARGRSAFGKRLIDQPLMRMVLADLLLEREASLAMAYEVARGFQTGDPINRLVTAIAKYWVTRRAVLGCIECVEALGGNGYCEEFPVARLYRDVQVNSTWEGSGNVMALDTLRALVKEPYLLDQTVARVHQLVDHAPDQLASSVTAFATAIHAPRSEHEARRFSGRTALALQAALLVHRAAVTGDEADACIAQAFIGTRLDASPERVFGDADHTLMDASDALLLRAPLPQ